MEESRRVEKGKEKEKEKEQEKDEKEEQSEDAVAAMFKKKKGRKKKNKSAALRRKVVLKKEEEEEEEADSDHREVLDGVKLLQKYRSRKNRAPKLGDVEDPVDEQEKEEESVESELGSSKQMGGVDFQQQNEVSIVDKEMEKYVLQELMKRRTGKDVTEEEEQKVVAPEDTLYQTPAHLKVPTMPEREESGDRWLVGITEVALPIETKFKNIEQTERAKQKLVAEQLRGRVDGDSVALPSNFSANYAQHQRDYAAKKREEFKNKGTTVRMGVPGENRPFVQTRKCTPPPTQAPMATDDRVVDRFIKKFKHR